MVVLGVGDDSRVERCCVIGTQQPERYGVVEGDVEQRLMTMALGQFVGTAFGIDRFSIPRRLWPSPTWEFTKSRQAGMMRAGLAPTSVISANSTFPALRPRVVRNRPIFLALTTTRVGSPAVMPSRIKLAVLARNSSCPA